MPPTVLPATQSTDALVDAIEDASARNVPLLLEPGSHFTRPGRLQKILIGANGLCVGRTQQIVRGQQTKAPVIKRPDRSLLPGQLNDNYGLSFVPAPPSHAEMQALHWQQAADGSEFAILIRGDIAFGGVDVDCNMHHQGLEDQPKHAANHSAMLKFLGRRYSRGNRSVYVGFRSVTLTDITIANGGFSDDIWISRGYFNPNIERVQIEKVMSVNRRSPSRSTVAFSGLCQNVVVRDSNIYRLELEETSRTTYRELPRRTKAFTRSSWKLENITAERIDLAANGKVYELSARNLTTTVAFQLHQAAGSIADSSLTMGDAHRMNRLDDFRFVAVTWTIAPRANGSVSGIRPNSHNGDPCSVAFLDNIFDVVGAPSSGQVIDSERSQDLRNRVTVSLSGCSYPDNFGVRPEMPVANVEERGHWTFATNDFGDRDLDVAVRKAPFEDVLVTFE